MQRRTARRNFNLPPFAVTMRICIARWPGVCPHTRPRAVHVLIGHGPDRPSWQLDVTTINQN
jgi:hypothetical protein